MNALGIRQRRDAISQVDVTADDFAYDQRPHRKHMSHVVHLKDSMRHFAGYRMVVVLTREATDL